MCYYVYADHAQYTIKTYAKMALFRLVLTGVLSVAHGSKRTGTRTGTSTAVPY